MFAYHSALHEPGQDVGHAVLVGTSGRVVVVDIAPTHFNYFYKFRISSRHVEQKRAPFSASVKSSNLSRDKNQRLFEKNYRTHEMVDVICEIDA